MASRILIVCILILSQAVDCYATKQVDSTQQFANTDRLKKLFQEGNFQDLEKEAKIMIADIPDPSLWCRIAHYLSMALHAQYKIEENLAICNNIIEKKKPDSLRYQEITSYIAMTETFCSIGNIETAEKCLKLASDLAGKMNECPLDKRFSSMAMLYMTESKILLIKKDYSRAIKAWKAAEEYAKTPYLRLTWLGQGGYIYEEKGDSVQADTLFLQALKYGRTSPNTLVCLIHSMAFRNRRGLFKESLRLLEDNLDITSYGNSPQLRKYLLATGEALAGSGKPEAAAEMFYEAAGLGDSLNNVEQQIHNQLLMQKINPEDYSSLRKEIDNLSRRNASAVMVFSFLGFIGIIVINRLLYRQRLHRKNGREAISRKNWAEIYNRIYIGDLKEKYDRSEEELISSSYQLSKMKARFEDIKRETEDTRPSSEKINSIRLHVREASLGGNESSDFISRLQKSNQAFIKQLTKKHPDLTKTEVTMCCYILTGMTGKEIASLTNRSPRTIDAIRYNIRKKLKISGSTESYMRQIASETEDKPKNR